MKETNMKTMRKNEFIAELARRTGLSQGDIDNVLKSQVSLVCEQLTHNGATNFPYFGKMKMVTYKALPERKGVNPRTGAPTVIPARANRVFSKMKLGKEFEDTLTAASLAKVQATESAPDEG
jgi:nucleoid DNA-binding protein